MFLRKMLLKGLAKFAPRPDDVRPVGRPLGRFKAVDIAYVGRIPGGFAGDITRPNPTIEPCLADPANPPTAAGIAVVADQTTVNGVRNVVAGDTSLTEIYGITVRPYPYQQASGSNYGATGFGPGVLAAAQPVDVCRRGYILAPCQGTPTKGAPVFVWVAASTGSHVQGGFESGSTGGSTIQLGNKTTFQGGLDANGLAEIAYNI